MASAEERDKIQKRLEELKASDWKQQKLKSWRPEPSLRQRYVMFCVYGVVAIILGAILLNASSSIFELELPYDDQCVASTDNNTWDYQTDGPWCDIPFTLETEVAGPVYFYYELDNFYQNHKEYVKSRSDDQLRGIYKVRYPEPNQFEAGGVAYNYESLDVSEDATTLHTADNADVPINITKTIIKDSVMGSCTRVFQVRDLWPGQQFSVRERRKKEEDDSHQMVPLSPLNPAVPCGLIAKSFFNDKYELRKADTTRIAINETDIAWSNDRLYQFKNMDVSMESTGGDAASWEDVQWLDMEDEHFIVWMRVAGLPSFRKLWGKTPDPLAAGDYTLKVQSNYAVNQFAGHKKFVLSTTNALGGKNDFLGKWLVVLGVLCLATSLGVFAYGQKKKQD